MKQIESTCTAVNVKTRVNGSVSHNRSIKQRPRPSFAPNHAPNAKMVSLSVYCTPISLAHRLYTTSHCPPPLSLLGGGLVALPLLEPSFPSAASLSKKSCHSSAKDSLLLELLAINIGSLTLLSEGVEGVRRKGEMGMRRPEVDAAPGRARPACSRCSVVFISE